MPGHLWLGEGLPTELAFLNLARTFFGANFPLEASKQRRHDMRRRIGHYVMMDLLKCEAVDTWGRSDVLLRSAAIWAKCVAGLQGTLCLWNRVNCKCQECLGYILNSNIKILHSVKTLWCVSKCIEGWQWLKQNIASQAGSDKMVMVFAAVLLISLSNLEGPSGKGCRLCKVLEKRKVCQGLPCFWVSWASEPKNSFPRENLRAVIDRLERCLALAQLVLQQAMTQHCFLRNP